MDNWFSSIPLATSLVKLTMIGKVHKNKPELQPVYYKLMKNIVMCIISTIHQEKSLSPSTKKPVIVEHCNQMKGRVNSFDQMNSVMSCSRKTKQWLMCIFYDIVNSTAINS